MAERKIIHIDMDAFYASVEQRDNPLLRGKPLIVGGTPERRGVVSAASYEARKYGIRSAMPTKAAMRLYPNLKIIQPNFEKYTAISEQLFQFYLEYTDIVEPLSLDECYLDVTENKLGIKTATEIGRRLKAKIKKELFLNASVGVAPNKLLAKIASEIDKPDGFFVIKPHQIENFMKNLDIKYVWGVGRVTYKKMQELGINTCGELQRFSLIELADYFGSFGETLYYFCRGIDNRKIIAEHEIKSIGSEITFPVDSNDLEYIKNNLYMQIERVYERLTSENIKAKTITLKAKYSDFSQITRSKTLDFFTSDMKEIRQTALELIKKTEIGRKKIRLIGVSISNFNTKENFQQLELL